MKSNVPIQALIGVILLSVVIPLSHGTAEDSMDEYHRLRGTAYTDAIGTGTAARAPASVDIGTLSEYLEYGALNNPDLEAAFFRWRATLEAIPHVRALPNPQLTYAYYLRNVETRVGPQRHRVEFTQQFPWFGTRDLKSDVSLEESRVAWEQFQARKLVLFNRISTAYYSRYTLSRSISVLEENMALLASLEHIVRTRYTTGQASHADLVNVQVGLSRLEERLAGLRDRRKPMDARLNALLNRPLDATVSVPDTVPPLEHVLAEDDLLERSFDHHPDLAALEHRRRKAVKAGELAGREYYPTFMLGIAYIETGTTAMPGVQNNGMDPLMPMISLSLPVWRDTYAAAEREAELMERATERQHDARATMIAADLMDAFYRYRDASRKIDLFRDSLIPKARQSLAVSQTGFRNGTAEFMNLIDAQRTLLEFELAYEEAVTGQRIALADIDLLSGGGLDRTGAHTE
jgi:outer membrane protein, heavy metal efflux system